MSQDAHTQSMTTEIAKELVVQVKDSIPDVIFEIIVGQMVIAKKAKRKIDDEGIVVRNIGGLVIPHPAIKVQNDAEKIVAGLMAKYAVS